MRLIEHPGDFHWRDNGEAHMNAPSAIAAVQDAARRKNQKAYEEYVTESDKQIRNCTLRYVACLHLTEIGRGLFCLLSLSLVAVWMGW